MVAGLASFELARRSAIKSDWIEMGLVTPATPGAALVFLFLGTGLGLRLTHHSVWRRYGAWSAFLLAAFIALHVVACRLAGTYPAWEAWFGPGLLAANAGQPAHVPLQAGVLFLVTCVGIWGLESTSRPRPIQRDLGLAAALAVQLFALVAAISYVAGNPPGSVDGWLKIAPPVIFGIALLNCILLASPASVARFRGWFAGSQATEASRLEEQFALRLGLGIMAVGLASAVWYLRHATHQVQQQALEQVSTNNDLKAQQVERWHSERMADAHSLMHAPFLHEVLQLADVQPRRKAVIDWLKNYQDRYRYREIIILDARKLRLRQIGEEARPPRPGDWDHLPEIGRLTGIVELPIRLDDQARLTWDVLVPIRSPDGDVPGAIVLRSDPVFHLWPILERWPDEFTTGQSALWVREGDQAFALAGYRARHAPASDRPRPFAVMRSVANMPPGSLGTRFLQGEIDRGEGIDFSGTRILAAGRQIRDTNWLVTSRLDATEVYGPLRRTALVVAGGLTALLVATGATASWLWRRKQEANQRERLSIELEQRRLATRLGQIMRHAKDIILVVDLDMRIVDANHQAEESYGYPKEELLRLTLADLRAPETLGDLSAKFSAAQQGDGAVFEAIQRRKDGRTFPVEVSTRIVELDGIRQLLAVIRDISERKRAEDELRASEERYRLIAENTSDVIWLVDLGDYRFKYVSPSTTRATGWLPAEIIGQPLGGFSTNSSGVRGKIEQQVTAFNQGDSSARSRIHEMELRHKDGTLRHVEILATLLPGPDGRAAMLLGVNRDFTERRQAQEALRASEERYRLIAENTSDVIWLYDQAKGAFTYLSPSVMAQLGQRPEDLIGRNLLMTLTPASAERAAGILADLAANPQQAHAVAELEQVHRDGHLVPSEIVASILRDESGKITHVLGVTRDITARRRAETEHREAQEAFANLERERKISEMKSQFISVASHEFRTPLAAATATLELLERHGTKLAETKQSELRRRIQVSLGRLTRIMNDVLQLSRADSGRVKVQRQDADLRQFLKDILDEVAAGDSGKHTLEFVAPDGARTVPFDSRLLHHIVSNLLGNAVRYSPAGTRISLVAGLRDTDFAITVTDEGIGIPAAERDRIFEPFARGSNVGTIGGTGLGLNIVKRYTELMGGQIELLPSERGAVFRVTIPYQANST